MTLLCLVLCACGMAAAHALQSTTSTVPERAALLSLVKQVASPAALFQTSKDDCRRVSEACEALERVAALDRPGFPRDLMLVDGRWRCIYTSAGVSVVPTPVLKLVGASPLGGLMPTRVEQRVDVMGRRVVNCVDLCPWPSGPLGNVLAGAPGPLGNTLSALREATISLELDHAFSVAGDGSNGGRRQAAASATIEVRLEEVRRRGSAPALRRGSAPALQPTAARCSPLHPLLRPTLTLALALPLPLALTLTRCAVRSPRWTTASPRSSRASRATPYRASFRARATSRRPSWTRRYASRAAAGRAMSCGYG